MSTSGSSRTATFVLLALAAVARIAAAWHWSGNLDDDRDVYRVIALGINEGRGFSSPGSTHPTAYRPPLYPLLLAATGGAHSTLVVAILNILLGTATVGFVLAAARELRLTRTGSLLAGLLTALDPLLLYYTSFPMTESLCSGLLTACLWAGLRMQSSCGFAQCRWGLVCGVLLGLGALCRPTVWACAVLLLAAWAVSTLRRHTSLPVSQPLRASTIVALLLTAALTVAPWGLRNWRVLGTPIITTTHGGYTLLLGNNPAYYDEVVSQPLGVVWDGSHGPGQAAWAAELNRELVAAGLLGEVERDRWMSQQARRNIAVEPQLFARACLRRLLHFWSIVPSVPADASLPRLAIWSVGAYYVAVFTAFAGGIATILANRIERIRWLIPLLLISGFVGVHLVYWSDARMRAPVTPEIALLAACGIGQMRRLRSDRH